MVDRGDADQRAHRIAERDRLQLEISNLIDLHAAGGVSIATTAPKIQERQTSLDRVERQLRTQRQLPPDIGRLREALEQRAETWKAELRAETQVARLVLRRLIGPIILWDDTGRADFCRWEATTKTELLDGLAGGPVCEIPRLG